MRAIVCLVLAIFFEILPTFAATPQSCPAGKPVTAFKLLVESPNGGPALPVNDINIIEKGDKLKYEPATGAERGSRILKGAKSKHAAMLDKPKGPARVAILLASASGDDAGHIEVLEVKPASIPEEWTVPARASILGLVYGPEGLSEHKINNLVKKNPELVLKLSDYVQQTSKMEALVQVLSKYQQSAPGTSNLQASLSEFSSQYGVALPAMSSGETSNQQAQQLLQALNPAFSANPLGQKSLAAQSTGIAASVATFFMGPQFGIVAGGTVLLGELHTVLFPRAEFRAAFAEPKAPAGMNLCTGKAAPPKAHTRLAYLWALPVPNVRAPVATIIGKARIPAGWKSSVEVKCASVSQLRLLARARDWRIVSGVTSVAIPAKVSVGPQSDFVSLDLSHVKLPAGEYHLMANWDWTPMTIAGEVQLLNFANYSSAKLSQASRDHLVSGTGTVPLEVAGPDFEFLQDVELLRAPGKSLVARLAFSFPDSEQAGEQKSVSADVDTSHLQSGAYFVQLTQLNGKAEDISVMVHPPNPTLASLPVRANLGQSQQTIELHGTSLNHIQKIISEGATWTLAAGDDSASGSSREATIRLGSKAKMGTLIDANVFVEGIHEPLSFSGVLRVAGPRPKILKARKSFATENGVALREKEIPANSEVSFSIEGAHFDSRAHLHLTCEPPEDTRQSLNLMPGQKSGDNELDAAGEGMLFLSVNVGEVAQSGCALTATLTDADTGTSDPYFLGQVIRLPRVDKFTLTDQKVGDAMYAGVLTGRDLQEIVKTGWDTKNGVAVEDIPTPVPGQSEEQTLKIAMPWPPPNPGAPLYIWLNGETKARATHVRYQ